MKDSKKLTESSWQLFCLGYNPSSETQGQLVRSGKKAGRKLVFK